MSDLSINMGGGGKRTQSGGATSQSGGATSQSGGATSRDARRVANPYLDSSTTSTRSGGGSATSGGIRQMHGRSPSGIAGTANSERSTAAERRGQPRPAPGASNKIQVHKRQEKNSLLRHIRNVPFEITPGLKADFVLGTKACALFISLRYHLLYPNYLIQRIKELSGHFTLRILLCHVDVDDNEKPLLEINKMAVLNDFTCILAWSLQEAARYLETYKAYEHKSAESIQEKVDDDYLSILQDCFGVVRSVNKSDALTLASNFGSLKAVCDASAEELALCPGLGDKKVARIHEALHAPLSRTKRSRPEK